MTYTKHVNYVHTSSLKKCDEEINLASPTLVFICHDCYNTDTIYPVSFEEPKEFPTLSFNSTISNLRITSRDEHLNIKKSCMGSIIANAKSHRKEVIKSENSTSATISFLSDPKKNLHSTYVFDSSRNQIFCSSYSSECFHEFAVLHPKSSDFKLKINSSSPTFAVFDVRRSNNLSSTEQTLVTVKSIIQIIFSNPKISNDIQLILSSIKENNNYVYNACIDSKNKMNFYVKKNNDLISSNNLELIKNNNYLVELGCVINHIPGMFTKIDSCIKNLESPACINQRSLKLFQVRNPMLESMIMQSRFLHLYGNIFLPSNDAFPEILSQITFNRNRFTQINNEYYMQILKANAQLIGVNKAVVTISLNDNYRGKLWSVLMCFNHISEYDKRSHNLPIILKSEKNCMFLIHNLNPSQVYIFPNTRRNIYAYMKDPHETIGDAFNKIQSCQINKISTEKMYHFYQRNTSDVIITAKQDENKLMTRIVCFSCIRICPREFIATTDSIKSESLNTSNSMITIMFENKYSPLILTDTQKISFW